MSRRHAAEKREIIPDPKFGNIVVSKFMNAIMYDGKKSVAEQIVYGALAVIVAKTKKTYTARAAAPTRRSVCYRAPIAPAFSKRFVGSRATCTRIAFRTRTRPNVPACCRALPSSALRTTR